MTWQQMLTLADECAAKAQTLLNYDSISESVSQKAAAWVRLAEYWYRRSQQERKDYTPYR